MSEVDWVKVSADNRVEGQLEQYIDPRTAIFATLKHIFEQANNLEVDVDELRGLVLHEMPRLAAKVDRAFDRLDSFAAAPPSKKVGP